MEILHIDLNNYEELVVKADKPVLLDFWAPWCGPCRMLGPIVENIAEEYPDVKVCKVNVDEEGDLAQQFGVMSIPAVFVLENGKITNQSVGVKPEQQLLEMLGL